MNYCSRSPPFSVQGPDLGVQYEWHRAVFEKDLEKLNEIKDWPENRWYEVDCRGLTLLHIAVLRGDCERIRFLLNAGCPLWVRDANGWTALDLAISTNQEDAIEILKQYATEEDGENKGKDEMIEDCRLCLQLSATLELSEKIYVYKLDRYLRIDFRKRSLWILQILGIPYLDKMISRIILNDSTESSGSDILSLVARPVAHLQSSSIELKKKYDSRIILRLLDRTNKCILWERSRHHLSVASRRFISLIDKRFYHLKKKRRTKIARVLRAAPINYGKKSSKTIQTFEARLRINERGLRLRPICHHGRLDCTWAQYRTGFRERINTCENKNEKSNNTTINFLYRALCQHPQQEEPPPWYYYRPSSRELPIQLITDLRGFLTTDRLLALLNLMIDPMDRRSPINKLHLFIDQYLARNEINGVPLMKINIDTPPPLELSFSLQLQEVLLLHKSQHDEETSLIEHYLHDDFDNHSDSSSNTTVNESLLSSNEILSSSPSISSTTLSSRSEDQNRAESQVKQIPRVSTINSSDSKVKYRRRPCLLSSIFRRRMNCTTPKRKAQYNSASTILQVEVPPTTPILDPVALSGGHLIPLTHLSSADFLVPPDYTRATSEATFHRNS
mmetsp:Transcript_13897/g.20856  ORF Transcript_13897/g.20856 Transcript_13897/m.20856 type:complete len:618 (+) Transcript_13897:23-1876(+)